MARIEIRAFYAKAQTRLHYFPIIASTAWFATLTILLLRWISIGRPQYPGQVNPHVPFISDIAAFQFKPVFIIGCTMTSICFVGTVWAVHHVRYSPTFYGLVDDVHWRKSMSAVALFTGFVAGACLFLLSIFDTLEEHEKHWHLLVGTFGGFVLSVLATEIVWWEETWKPMRFSGLRKWCILNNVLVTLIAGVGVAFLVLLYTDYFKSAGLMEWTVTYLGAFWLASFSGYIRFREDDSIADVNVADEHQPLLVSA